MERSETIQLTGVRCERCVHRLAAALQGHEGLVHANATLLGELTLAWDDDLTTREELLSALAKAGFREAQPV